MRNIYEAAQKQSASLALLVEKLALQRGWAARTISGMLVDVPEGSGSMLMIYGASVMLPLGRAVSFTPSARPRFDGDTWMIDIRRSDGVSRPAWNQGIAIKRAGKEYGLFFGNTPIDDASLDELLDAIVKP